MSSFGLTEREARRSQQALVGIGTVLIGAVLIVCAGLEVFGVRLGWWWVLPILLSWAVTAVADRVGDLPPTPPEVLADEAKRWAEQQAGDPDLSGSHTVWRDLDTHWRGSAPG